MTVRTAAAGTLAASYTAACAWSLWDRRRAVEFFAAASLISTGYIISHVIERVLLGVLYTAAAGALWVYLPGAGAVVVCVAAAVAVMMQPNKFRAFAAHLPSGLSSVLLYLMLWAAPGRIPHGVAVTGAHHAAWFSAAAVAASLAVGALYLLSVTSPAVASERRMSTALFYAAGYPWYFAFFALTLFVPDGEPRRYA